MQLQPRVGLTWAINHLNHILQGIDRDLTTRYDVDPTALNSREAHDRWLHYFDWCGWAERMLREVFADSTLVEVLQSRRHWHIQSVGPEPRTIAEITNELTRLRDRFRQERDHLELYLPLASRNAWPMMLDTSAWLHFDPLNLEPNNPNPISQADWYQLIGAPAGAMLWLVVPVVTLDELDRLANNRETKQNARARIARRSIATFHRKPLTRPPAAVDATKPWMVGEALPDLPGHRQNPDADMELLERAQFLHQVTDSTVTVVAADLGMQLRGDTIAAVGLLGVSIAALDDKFRLPDHLPGPPKPPKAPRGKVTAPAGAAGQPSRSPQRSP